MKKLSLIHLCLLFVAMLLGLVSNAQNNNLAAGDIAFVSYHADSDGALVDQFSIVVLAPAGIPAGTVMFFTDDGYSTSDGNFIGTIAPSTNEGYIKWTAPVSGVAQGIEIKFSSTGSAMPVDWSASVGTVTEENAFSLALAFAGDQVLAYQTGPTAGPASTYNNATFRFIAAVHSNTATGSGTSTTTWDIDNPSTATTIDSRSNRSNLPAGLTSTTGAIVLHKTAGTNINAGPTSGATPAETDDAKYNCTGSGPGNTNVAAVRTAILNAANWTFSDAAFAGASSSNCAFGSPLPVTIVSFTGKLNTDRSVLLQWEVAEQISIRAYDIEVSADGRAFSNVATVNANTLRNYNYHYTDRPTFNGKLFYRLRIHEASGAYNYTQIVSVSVRANGAISLFPNPAKNEVVLQQTGNGNALNEAVLSDMNGRIVKRYNIIQLRQTLSLNNLSSGVYWLKLSNGQVIKLNKQD
jgi:hypothetical protein